MAQADGAAPGQPSVFKLVLLGGGSVGKSSLALRFAKGDFKSILPTVGSPALLFVILLPSLEGQPCFSDEERSTAILLGDSGLRCPAPSMADTEEPHPSQEGGQRGQVAAWRGRPAPRGSGQCWRCWLGAFFTKLVDVGAASVKLEIWDTAGQEKYHSVCHLYFRGADAALLVYDITSKDSFCKAQQWLKELEKELPLGDVVVMLVGNKTDLGEEREVSVEEGAEFAASQCLLFMETSARLNHQVTEAFDAVAQELVRRAEEKAEKQTPRGRAQLAANQAPGAARCCGH